MMQPRPMQEYFPESSMISSDFNTIYEDKGR